MRLEEIALREAEKALKRRPKVKAPDGPMTLKDVHWMDPTVALQLLREHKRGLAGVTKPGRAPQRASLEETCQALAKRLRAFGRREGVLPPEPDEKNSREGVEG